MRFDLWVYDLLWLWRVLWLTCPPCTYRSAPCFLWVTSKVTLLKGMWKLQVTCSFDMIHDTRKREITLQWGHCRYYLLSSSNYREGLVFVPLQSDFLHENNILLFGAWKFGGVLDFRDGWRIPQREKSQFGEVKQKKTSVSQASAVVSAH